MPDHEIDLFQIDRGAVLAPAGCGKTHLIIAALARHKSTKPVLVLTHTNAGVAALRERLAQVGVSPSSYRLMTIDGWAIRLVSTFPVHSGLDPKLLDLARPGSDYPMIRDAAIRLLQAGHIADVLIANYARLIVDEYQDCSSRQHALITWAAQCLPTCVLGDPLQAIFNFGSDRLPDWSKQVLPFFPVVGELSIPWRWNNVGAEALGNWLLECRWNLLSGNIIDLSTAPGEVQWIALTPGGEHAKLLAAARTAVPGGHGRALIIGDSMNVSHRHRVASAVPGAITIEAVDLRDFIAFARELDIHASDALSKIAMFGQSLMTNAGATGLIRRVDSLVRGTARKEPTVTERSALAFLMSPSYQAVADFLTEASRAASVRIYRPAVLRACLKALQAVGGTENLTFLDAALRVREQNRMQGRSLPKRGVGSTLLLKGLEAEIAVVLNAADLDTRNLYVAMTRGSKALIICSPSSLLSPRS